jgi:RNA polymerase sigma factor (sigma-70 family)
VTELSDETLHALLHEDAERGWRAFIDQHTPALLALIKRAGVGDRDEILDLYVRVCRHLGEGGCARLRRHDPAQGALRAWLAVVVRHVVTDWVRSRAGRRRVFGTVKALPPGDREVFELYYWDERPPSEIVEVLSARRGRRVPLADVLESLDRIQAALSQRQRSELLSLSFRVRRGSTPRTDDDDRAAELRDERPDPEASLARKEAETALSAALARLTPEEGAIVRLKFVQGLTHAEIARALHLERLTDDRVKAILAKLRTALSARARMPGAATVDLPLLEGPQ